MPRGFGIFGVENIGGSPTHTPLSWFVYFAMSGIVTSGDVLQTEKHDQRHLARLFTITLIVNCSGPWATMVRYQLYCCALTQGSPDRG